jgi:HK97 family phage prohead protease
MSACTERPASDIDAPAMPPTRAPALGETVRVVPGRRTLEVTLATPRRDRQGDIVEPDGLDFTHFLKNPVVLWAHDLAAPPVGRVLSVRKEPGRIGATILFAETRFAKEVFELYAGGFLRAWSLGFLPKRWERLPGTRRGFRIREAEVVEVSAVPVPANPEALTRALDVARDDRVRRALADHADPAEPSGPADDGASAGAAPARPKRRLRAGESHAAPDDALRKRLAAACAERAVRLVPTVMASTLAHLRGRLA